jgi:hypothetical protein
MKTIIITIESHVPYVSDVVCKRTIRVAPDEVLGDKDPRILKDIVSRIDEAVNRDVDSELEKRGVMRTTSAEFDAPSLH